MLSPKSGLSNSEVWNIHQPAKVTIQSIFGNNIYWLTPHEDRNGTDVHKAKL